MANKKYLASVTEINDHVAAIYFEQVSSTAFNQVSSPPYLKSTFGGDLSIENVASVLGFDGYWVDGEIQEIVP